MLSNKTGNFKTIDEEEEEEEMQNPKESILKQLTTPLPQLQMTYTYTENDDKEYSYFSFRHNLLSQRAYKFLKDKDECLAVMELDDSIPESN